MEKLPLILLHGALGSAALYESLRELTDRDTHAINFSGHGHEPFNDKGFNIHVFADEVIAYMDAHGIDKADLFGFSMGGYVGYHVCKTYPDRVGAMTTLGTKIDWTPESAGREVRFLDPLKISEKVPAFAKVLLDRHGAGWSDLCTRMGALLIELGDGARLQQEDFQSINTPVTIVRGSEDEMVTEGECSWAAQQLQSASFIMLEGEPHLIEKCTPAAVAGLF